LLTADGSPLISRRWAGSRRRDLGRQHRGGRVEL